MSESSDDPRAQEDSSGESEPEDSEEDKSVQTLRREVEEKYDFCRDSIYAV